MTAINRLTQKTTVVDGDLIPLWDTENGQTRTASFSTLKTSMIFVSDITVVGSVLTVHYSNGTSKDLNI